MPSRTAGGKLLSTAEDSVGTGYADAGQYCPIIVTNMRMRSTLYLLFSSPCQPLDPIALAFPLHSLLLGTLALLLTFQRPASFPSSCVRCSILWSLLSSVLSSIVVSIEHQAACSSIYLVSCPDSLQRLAFYAASCVLCRLLSCQHPEFPAACAAFRFLNSV